MDVKRMFVDKNTITTDVRESQKATGSRMFSLSISCCSSPKTEKLLFWCPIAYYYGVQMHGKRNFQLSVAVRGSRTSVHKFPNEK